MTLGHVRPGADGRWPLVGREEELDFVRRHRSSAPLKSIVLSGAPGVGKSRVAHEIMEEVRAEPDWSTLTIPVAAGMDALPFGALRVALDLGAGTGEVAELSDAVVASLGRARAGRNLMIMVDDAHHLDHQSAGLLHASVARGDAAILATVRTGEPTPPAITALWKDALAERLELQPISRLELMHLLAAVLGPSVEDSTAERIWHATEGNPLYLREIVQASIETGALKEVEGQWRWRSGWASASRLQEIVAERLGRLDAEELSLVEAIAVGGRLPVKALVDLGPETALSRLEARGLVTVEPESGNPVVTLTHPIHTEVVRSRLPALQARSICRTLANTMSRVGGTDPSDQIRLALWSLEAGIPVHPVSLRRAADATLWHVGEAIADRIQELLPGVVGRARPVLAQGPDVRAALRLAEAAWESGGGVAAGASLAVTLAWAGDIGRAESVLSQLQSEVHEPDDRLRVAVALAHVQFWGEWRYEDAMATLEKAEAHAPPSAAPELVAEVIEARAGLDLNIGRPADAVERATAAAALRGLDLPTAPSAPTMAAGLAMLGRLQEALDLIDSALPHALVGAGHPLAAAQLLLARCAALGRMGRLHEGLELAENLRRVAIDVDSLDGTAVFGVVAGDILILQGRPATAARFFRDAAGLLDERDVLGYRPWALAGLARARVFLGDERGAVEAMESADEIAVIPRYFRPRLDLARANVRSMQGRHLEAVEILREGAAWCAEAGMVVEEALLLDAWTRLDQTEEAADRLQELPALTDGVMVPALARHARALLNRDPKGLLDCAEIFANNGGWLAAAAAAGAAAGVLADRHRERESGAAARQALGWYSHCEGARSPLLDRLVAPSTLTSRELEVARLAALGHSSKDIADRLVVSVRTVDAHLYRAYSKLGVHYRAELAAVLGIDVENSR
jgi:DNA-binding CsgD family transcriptional regulator